MHIFGTISGADTKRNAEGGSEVVRIDGIDCAGKNRDHIISLWKAGDVLTAARVYIAGLTARVASPLPSAVACGDNELLQNAV